MNLYYVYQNENTGKDTYHAMIVAAESADEAKTTHPDGDWDRVDTWCYSEEDVFVDLIGVAANDVSPGIILSSFS